MLVSTDEFEKKVEELKPYHLDTSKCTPHTSFYQQLFTSMKGSTGPSERQKHQFNMGNGHRLSTPFIAAEYLFEREYKDTFFFEEDQNKTIFIPPVFISNLYGKNSSVLDYDIVADMKRTGYNMKTQHSKYSFSKELQDFLEMNTENDISKKNFDNWIIRVKILFLICENVPSTDYSRLPRAIDSISSELSVFINDCLLIIDPSEEVVKEMKKIALKTQDKINKWIKKKIGHIKIDDSILRWFFNLEFTTVSGEDMEHWLYNQLRTLANICTDLSDFVIMHSADFFTDERTKKHQELDFILFSYKRKIIIAIEAKRSVTITAFNQLQKYQSIFEERFGDQLDNEWKFLPILCAEHIPFQTNSEHVITKKTNIQVWFEELLKKYPILNSTLEKNKAKEQLKKVLEILIFIIHIPKSQLPDSDLLGPITSSKWVRYITEAIDTVSTSDNIIFYSNTQLPIMCQEYKKVTICGEYGTGKSILLQAKAENLAQSEKVLFVFGRVHVTVDKQKSLYELNLLEKWNKQRNIKFLTEQFISEALLENGVLMPSNILNYLQEHNIKNVFIDEWSYLFDDQQFLVEFKELTEKVEGHLWVAWDRNAQQELRNLIEKIDYLPPSEFIDNDFLRSHVKKEIPDYDADDDEIEKIKNGLSLCGRSAGARGALQEVLSHTIQKKFFEFYDRVYNHCNLIYNMRNSKEITREAISCDPRFKPAVKLFNFPDGVRPHLLEYEEFEDSMQNIVDAFKYVRKATKEGILFIIGRLELGNEKEFRMIFETIKDTGEQQVEVYLSEDRSQFHQYNSSRFPDVLPYLAEKKGVLITEATLTEGFEWPTVILYVPLRNGLSGIVASPSDTLPNQFLRCISNLVIIQPSDPFI